MRTAFGRWYENCLPSQLNFLVSWEREKTGRFQRLWVPKATEDFFLDESQDENFTQDEIWMPKCPLILIYWKKICGPTGFEKEDAVRVTQIGHIYGPAHLSNNIFF